MKIMYYVIFFILGFLVNYLLTVFNAPYEQAGQKTFITTGDLLQLSKFLEVLEDLEDLPKHNEIRSIIEDDLLSNDSPIALGDDIYIEFSMGLNKMIMRVDGSSIYNGSSENSEYSTISSVKVMHIIGEKSKVLQIEDFTK